MCPKARFEPRLPYRGIKNRCTTSCSPSTRRTTTEAAPAVRLGKDADGPYTDAPIPLVAAPCGYECTSLMDGILAVSRAEPSLTDASLAKLAGVTAPMHIRVLTTPTCQSGGKELLWGGGDITKMFVPPISGWMISLESKVILVWAQ